jgi:ankyrin repeat protein
MVTVSGRASHFRASQIIAFLLLLTWGNLAFAAGIHEAVKKNDVAKVKNLIKNNPDLLLSKDEDGFTPLHLAAANGYKEMTEFLLASKADVNAKDNSGSTPLHQAATAEAQNADVLEMLIARKADVNATDTNGLTPLHYAALADRAKSVKVLLGHGAHADVKDKVEGNTPLIIAAGEGYKDVVEVLLANGADVNDADKMGTPLAWALHTGHTDVADLIRQHGGHE